MRGDGAGLPGGVTVSGGVGRGMHTARREGAAGWQARASPPIASPPWRM